jgi:hypothetical protein
MLLSVLSAVLDIYTAVQIRRQSAGAPALERVASARCRASGLNLS